MKAKNRVGRPLVKDKKVPITLYFKKSTIKRKGGMDKFRKLCYSDLTFLEEFKYGDKTFLYKHIK